LGLLQIDRGYPVEARQYLDETLSRAEQIGHSFYIALTNQHLSLLFNTIGEWTTALEYSNRSEALFKSLGEKTNLADVYVNMGSIYFGLHDLLNSSRCGEQALALLDEDETEVKGSALRLLGDIALSAHDFETAEKLYKQAEVIFQSVGNRLERGRLLMSLARLAKLKSNRKLSTSCLLLAQKMFEQLGARLDLQKLDVLKKELAAKRKH
jgi:tetratricopeptide (TPR) repeat protein